MAHHNLHVDFTHLYAGLDSIGLQVTTHIGTLVAQTAVEARSRWGQKVMHANGIWDKEKHDYVHSLEIAKVHNLYHEVSTEYRYAGEIEKGRPAKDMKRMLDTSLKVRVAKGGQHAGQRYLIIPFRHNTPGNSAHAPAMPKHVYQMAKGLTRSRVAGQGKRLSVTGAMDIHTKKHLTVNQSQYKWGGRLPSGTVPKMKPHHTTDIYSNMVKMGIGGHTQYMTFRIMGEWQTDKWITSPKPGNCIAQGVAREMKPNFEEAAASIASHVFY